jgi:hypothetical protein
MANEYRIEALAAEVFAEFPADARVNALAVEVFAAFPVSARIGALAVEVWHTITVVSPRRRNSDMVI